MTAHDSTSVARDQAGDVAETTRLQAGRVASSAGESARDVAGTAREQAQRVAGEASQQARNVVEDLRAQLSAESSTQTTRLAGNLRRLSAEAATMAETGDRSTPLPGLMEQLAQRGAQTADYLEQRGPDGVLAEVRSFARRRPAAFLLGAAVAGFAVGRIGRGAKDASSSAADQPSAAPGQAADPLGDHRPAIPHDTVVTGYGAATTGEPYPYEGAPAGPAGGGVR